MHTFLVCHLAAPRAWSTGATIQWRGTEKCLDHEACNYFVATLLALLTVDSWPDQELSQPFSSPGEVGSVEVGNG